MEFYFFRHAQWKSLYNCSYDVDIIPVEQRAHVTHGLMMISLATLFLLIYLPPLYVIMFNCLDKSAYQIMFLIGIYDVLSLVIDAIREGIMSIYGHVFCSLPVFSYIVACFCMATWVSSKECCIILFVYRCLELWRPNVADILFKGKRTFVWIGLSLLHFAAMVFTCTPMAYNPMIGTILINPHAGYIDDPKGKYYNAFQTIYNWGVCLAIVVVYIAFISLMVSNRMLFNFSGPSLQHLSTQRKALIQALIIASCGTCSDAYWFIITFGSNPPQIVVFIGTYTWIFSIGAPGVVYITMNKTIRRHIWKLFNKNDSIVISLFTKVDRNAVQILSKGPMNMSN